MELLGMKQVPGSGSSWIAKEDGENEDVLCQLKSTDAESIRIRRQDIEALKYHAMVTHKLPVFAIQFLQGDDVYLLLKPQDVPEVNEFLKLGKYMDKDEEGFWELLVASEDNQNEAQSGESSKIEYKKPKIIKSSEHAREQFMKQNSKKFEKKERKAT